VLITDYRSPDPVDFFTTQFQEDKSIRMNWNSNDVPGGLRNYLLLRRQINPAAGNSFTQVNSERLTDTSYVDPGVGDGQFVEGATYEYGISVVSNNGNYSDTLFTEIKIPDLTPPDPPSMLRTAMEEGQRVSITWNASSSTDVNRYKIYRENPLAESDSLLTELPRSRRYFRDDQIEIGTTYLYHIASVDSAENESELLSDSLTTSLTHPPASVRNLQVLFTDEGVLLSWENNNEFQIDGFRIYKSDIATGVFELIGETDKESNSWTDSSGTAGEWYKVFPIDAIGREARTARAAQATERNSRKYIPAIKVVHYKLSSQFSISNLCSRQQILKRQ
jgi:fibronectin type 3 domain-containing protein